MGYCQGRPRDASRRPPGRVKGDRAERSPLRRNGWADDEAPARCCAPGLSLWRRWGDSNSRGASTPTSLAGRRTRPLCDISIAFPQPVPWDARAAYREDAPASKPQEWRAEARASRGPSTTDDEDAEATVDRLSGRPGRQVAQACVDHVQRACETCTHHPVFFVHIPQEIDPPTVKTDFEVP